MIIENTSLDSIRTGEHTDMGNNSLLIQITDPGCLPPIPKQKFKTIVHFEFLDLEEGDECSDEAFKISDVQAMELVSWLQYALDHKLNVLVHCHAGVCRSGAVVEVGSMLGFTPTNRFRAPNLLVKHKMLKYLGWTYDSDEQPYQVNVVDENE